MAIEFSYVQDRSDPYLICGSKKNQECDGYFSDSGAEHTYIIIQLFSYLTERKRYFMTQQSNEQIRNTVLLSVRQD